MLLANNLVAAQEIASLVSIMERLDEKSRGIDELLDLMKISGYGYDENEIHEIVSVELHMNDAGQPSLCIKFTFDDDGETDTGNFYVSKKDGVFKGDF